MFKLPKLNFQTQSSNHKAIPQPKFPHLNLKLLPTPLIVT